jgi:glycerol-3-phosphate O-acyltransferase/dihydroxyacetone phosphate acyltransferase
MIQRLIRAAAFAIGRLFYPRVAALGTIPDGPLLIAPNHPNGLLDGLVLLMAARRPVAFLAKSTFFHNPLLAPLLRAFSAVPVYRPQDAGKPGGQPNDSGRSNDETFTAARQLLANGGALAIFPEGTPNLGQGLLPLKTGAARIALGAEAEAGWALGLRLLPVGLWFEDQARARTAALVLTGRPIAVSKLRAIYENDPAAAVRALTEQLRDELTHTTALANRAGRLLMRIRRRAARRSRISLRKTVSIHTIAYWLILIFGAPIALLGAILVLPGLALAQLTHLLLTRRHRAGVGTARVIALVGALVCGWLAEVLVAAWAAGWIWGLAVLVAGPALGYVALRWGEVSSQ